MYIYSLEYFGGKSTTVYFNFDLNPKICYLEVENDSFFSFSIIILKEIVIQLWSQEYLVFFFNFDLTSKLCNLEIEKYFFLIFNQVLNKMVMKF